MRSSSRPCGCEEDARFGASTNGLQRDDCRGGEGHPRGVTQEERRRGGEIWIQPERDADEMEEVEGNSALAR